MITRLKLRAMLMGEVERFSGMPTLEYDDIIEDLTNRIIIVEKRLVKTCSGCGGEIIPEDIEVLHYEPANGLCAMELESCEEE